MPTPPMPLAQGHHTPAALSPGEAWEGGMSLAGSPTQRGRSGGRGAEALGGLEGRGSHGPAPRPHVPSRCFAVGADAL